MRAAFALWLQHAHRPHTPSCPTAQAPPAQVHAPPTLRSRVSNHADLLPQLDGRSSAARRFRDLVAAYVSDMGGLDMCSEIKLGLLRRLAATTVQSEILEAQMINGNVVDVSVLCTLASTSVRIAQRLGIERKARDITPQTLSEYLEGHAEADA